MTYADASYEQYEYADHSLIAARDRAGQWTRYAYNALRQRVVTRDPAGQVTQTQWCRCGRLKRLVDGAGNITEWARDEAGRPTQKIYADGSHEDYGYDFSGRLVTETDPMSRTKTYGYTLDDRLSSLDYSDSGTPDVSYSYDPYFPRLTSRSDGAGTTSYSYHPLDGETLGAGQVSLIDGPLDDDTQKHTYDELGRLSKLEIVDDATQTTASYSEEVSFDSRGRVSGVDNNLGSFGYSYAGQSSRVVGGGLPKRDADPVRLPGRGGRSAAQGDQKPLVEPERDQPVRLRLRPGAKDHELGDQPGGGDLDLGVFVRPDRPAHRGGARGRERHPRARALRLRRRREPGPGGDRDDVEPGGPKLRGERPEPAQERAGVWEDDVRGDLGRAGDGDGERPASAGVVDGGRGALALRGGGGAAGGDALR